MSYYMLLVFEKKSGDFVIDAYMNNCIFWITLVILRLSVTSRTVLTQFHDTEKVVRLKSLWLEHLCI